MSETNLVEEAECAMSDLAIENTQIASDALTVMRKLITALTQAQARIAELEKDAARYRWLRLHAKDGNVWQPINAPELFDAAIDAALKERQ